jgi:hypothetical protein
MCDICISPFCEGCATIYDRPEVDRCGSDVPAGTEACCNCGMSWKPLSPLSDDSLDGTGMDY